MCCFIHCMTHLILFYYFYWSKNFFQFPVYNFYTKLKFSNVKKYKICKVAEMQDIRDGDFINKFEFLYMKNIYLSSNFLFLFYFNHHFFFFCLIACIHTTCYISLSCFKFISSFLKNKMRVVIFTSEHSEWMYFVFTLKNLSIQTKYCILYYSVLYSTLFCLDTYIFKKWKRNSD